jgi:hypothetical protein
MMADYTHNSLEAAIKSLEDVVAPSINPADPLAIEQLRLTVDYLRFIKDRLDFLYDREKFDLRHHLVMAKKLRPQVTSIAALKNEDMDTIISYSEALLKNNTAPVTDFRSATAALAHLICQRIQEVKEVDEKLVLEIEKIVLRQSKERINMERSWYAPLGFDPQSIDLQPLTEIFYE